MASACIGHLTDIQTRPSLGSSSGASRSRAGGGACLHGSIVHTPCARTGQCVRVSSPESSDVSDDVVVAERLANLQALTDSTLTQLDVDELLVELLARVREILDVDTAAVLLLDEQADELVARAACGIEDEVRQGVRVPLGTGFAGRIAATKQAVRLDHVDSTTVANPILWENGIKVMLGVPLLRGDEVLGVLHVGRLENRPFNEDDAELLQIVADRVAGAIQTRQLAIERAATATARTQPVTGEAAEVSGTHLRGALRRRRRTRTSAVIGMTFSRCRRANFGSLLATSPVMVCKRQS